MITAKLTQQIGYTLVSRIASVVLIGLVVLVAWAAVAPNRRKHAVDTNVRTNVEAGSKMYTDEFNSYMYLKSEYAHEIVNHLESYVNGRVHTNGLENFWSLLKRTLKGTYVSVDPAHLFRYLDEQCFRFNRRRFTDAERFALVIGQVIGRRLTYAELTGKSDMEGVPA